MLGRRGATARTRLNLNNQIGLPLSMLAATGEEAFWVMEAGISHAGDMDELGAILEPDVALILNVGPGHAAGLGDRGTAYYKARLLSYLAPGGMAVVSADYPNSCARPAPCILSWSFFPPQGGRSITALPTSPRRERIRACSGCGWTAFPLMWKRLSGELSARRTSLPWLPWPIASV
ncbi:MAG: Mur ligase family protein [Bilophila sp.]